MRRGSSTVTATAAAAAAAGATAAPAAGATAGGGVGGVGEFGDVVIDVSTCVLVRDIGLLTDTHQSQSLALTVSALANNFTRCCVILAPPPHHHINPASHLHDPAHRE